MSKRDYYEILEVTQTTTDREIKRSYKRLAMRYHPDRNAGDDKAAEKFKEIKEAYEILSDPQKKAAYDQYGHAAFEQGGHGAHGGFGGADFGDIFGDVFGDIFGGGRRGGNQHQAQRGSDLKYDIELTLEEAVKGCTKDISISILSECEKCNGSGAEKGSSATTCPTCHGQGQVQMRQGFFAVQQTCPTCHGTGKIIKNPCKSCFGEGRVKKKKNLSVKIPSGVDTGDRIRLTGEGEAGEKGAPAGDLYVEVHIKQHEIFQRDGNNLYCEVPISFTMAALGGNVEVPTLDGKVNLKVPSETQTDKMFRMRGKGVKSIRSHSKGDLVCKLVIETPVSLSTRQKELLQEFESTFEGKNSSKHKPKSHGFFTGVKKFIDDLTS